MPLVMYAQTDSIASSHDLQEVEVISVGKSNSIRSLAPKYTISSSDFIQLNISDVTYALRRLPGITLRDYGGAGGMKTVSVRGMGSQHNGVILDGVMLNDLQSGQIDLQQFQLSEISSLSLVIGGNEDIFQPATNFSKASVLSLQTDETVNSKAMLTLGSWGLISPSVHYGHKFNKVITSFSAGYTYADNDYPFLIENGVATHTERRKNSQIKQSHVTSNFRWQLSPSSTMRAMLRLNDNNRELPGIVHLYNNNNDETLHDRGILSQLQLTSSLGSKWYLKSALRWNLAGQDYHNGVPSGGILSENYTQREYYSTVALLFKPTTTLNLAYSVDYTHQSLSIELHSNLNRSRNSLLQSLSGKWNYRNLTIVGQVLNSNIEKERRLSPSLSASYAFLADRSFNVRLSMKDIFRMPTMTELYYFHFGSQYLEPEKSRQLNLGLTYETPNSTSNKLHFGATIDAYLNEVKDKIVAIPFNTFVWRYLNLSKVQGKGLDFICNFTYNLSSGQDVQFTANYSLQDIENHNSQSQYYGNGIAYVPVHSGSGSVSWINPWVNISSTLTYASETWTTNEHNAGTRIEGYSELALSAFRSFPLKSNLIETAFTIQNIFNENYCIIAHYPMPGRNWKISITYKF